MPPLSTLQVGSGIYGAWSWAVAPTALQQGVAADLFIVAAVCISGAAIVEAVEKLLPKRTKPPPD